MYARIDAETHTCAEFIDFDPEGRFHPAIIWLEVPETLQAYVDYAYVAENGEIQPPTLDYLRDQVKSQIADYRWKVEGAGITYEGTPILTAKDDRDKLNDAVQTLEDGTLSSVKWKSPSGWIAATVDDLKPLQQAVRLHVQACYTHENALHDALDAVQDVDAILAVDWKTGWPETLNNVD